MRTKTISRITWLLLSLLLVFLFAMPVCATPYKTVTSEKTKIGSYYVWRPYNNEFHIQRAGSDSVTKLTRDVYTVAGVTNGSTLFYTALGAKHSGYVILYKYNIKTGKQKKIGKIKKALHIAGYYKNCVYGNGEKHRIYKYNVKTKKKTTLIKNAWLEEAVGKYLYIQQNDKWYRYNLSTTKKKKINWKYD